MPVSPVDSSTICHEDHAASPRRTVEAAVEAVDLDELARRFQAGHPRAFDALFERAAPLLMPVISRFIWNQDDAEDALQDVAIQLYRALPRFRFDSRVSTFLYRIAVNVCLNARTRMQRRPELFGDLMPDASSDDVHAALCDTRTPDKAVIAHERRRALYASIASLAPKYRAAYVLIDVAGMSYEESADILQVPVGTVRSRLHRARATMQKNISAHLELFADAE